MQILGILGGLGPESSGEFYLSLIKRFQEVCQPETNLEYPHILMNSIPAPELTDGIITDEILDVYKNGLKELETWGADSMIIVCNTAYCFLEELQSTITVPIWNVIDEVGKNVAQSQKHRLLVLASPTSIRCNLYSYPFIFNLELSDSEVIRLGELISMYNLTSKIDQDGLRSYLEKIDEETLVIAGCTEIAQIFKRLGISFLDPMQIMIDAIVARWNFLKKCSLEIHKSEIHGFGVFTSCDISANSVICEIPIGAVSDKPVKKWVHLDGKWFCDNKITNWINHSCEANAKLELRSDVLILTATEYIHRGDEISCNYDESEIGGNFVPCTCSTSSCRKFFLRIDL